MVVLTKAQKSAIVGMILGDGFLQKTGKNNARLRLEHSFRQKEYLKWKVSLIPQLFSGKITHLERVHPKTRKKYHYVRAQSNASPYLGKLRNLFYVNGKKRIPEKLSSLLRHPLGLAIWYYDDGYYYSRDKVGYLYLGKVERKEAEIAQKLLAEKWGIRTRVLDKENKGFVLYFSSQEIRKLSDLLKPFRIPAMEYKFPS
jgi:hypothetical protein